MAKLYAFPWCPYDRRLMIRQPAGHRWYCRFCRHVVPMGPLPA